LVMGTSCTDVCDLMIDIVCKDCSARETCVDADEDVSGSTDFHDQLLGCISEHVKVRAWLAWLESDIIATFNNLEEQGVLEDKIPEGFDIKEHVKDIIAELPIDSMTTSINERLWDEVQIYMETFLEEDEVYMETFLEEDEVK